jgi:alpha-tubulin suppressor-like RCC1 family protein
MPSLNIINTQFKLGKKIEALTSSNTNFELLSMAKAIKQFGLTPFITVQNVANLPSAASNASAVYYVVAEDDYFYSNGANWVLFTEGQKLYTWGGGTCGQLGGNFAGSRSSPNTVAGGGTSWCRVDVGDKHTVAFKKSGSLWIWGKNQYGQLGDGTTSDRFSPVTPSGSDGTWCQAKPSSCDGNTTVAVKTNGTLWVWGRNANGQLGDNTSIDRSSPVTTAGGGTTWCYASAGTCHSAAVKTDGTLWTWGAGTSGRLGTGNLITRSSPVTIVGGLTSWSKVCAGKDYTAGIRTNGTLYLWGANTCGKLGDSSTINKSSPVSTNGGGFNWCVISLGDDHAIGIKADGTAWTWGRNSAGQLGSGNTINRSSPALVAGSASTWCDVTAGFSESAGVQTTGTLWTWGCNNLGQLGTGTTINRSSPVTIVNSIDWLTVSMGCQSTAAIQSF